MLRRSTPQHFRGGRMRGYLLKDPTLSSANGHRSSKMLTRLGIKNVQAKPAMRENTMRDMEQWEHAFPLLTNTSYGHQDQSNDTRLIELAKYLPKRAKGLAPWFRGSNTYSPLYAEQGRYEYRRYQMVTRMPSEFKERFMETLGDIRDAVGRSEPIEVLHALSKLILDHYNPQHIHYLAALEGLTSLGEFSKARDVWKMMERQMTWPDDKLIAAYLDLCVAAKKKEWAFECWNRYCTEKRFLAAGEPDPKPVSRTPFTLNRDEMIHLPKWKKFFDHDPNLDVADRNRFNTTRQLYLNMARAVLSGGEYNLFAKYFNDLEAAMLSTPSPVPEPPDTVTVERPAWEPSWDQDRLTSANPFVIDRETAKHALGPQSSDHVSMAPRFFRNDQFLLHAAAKILNDLALPHTPRDALPPGMDKATAAAFADELVERVLGKLGARLADVDLTELIIAAIRAQSATKHITGDDARQLAAKLVQRKAKVAAERDGGEEATDALHPSVYREILRVFRVRASDRSAAASNPRDVITSVTQLLQEMASTSTFEWAADHHLEVVGILVATGTMTANTYFVKNVLRKFPWDSQFAFQLYQEYRRHSDVELWAELTKRMLVWTARYNVDLDEVTKRAIEDDYDVIGVQVRSFKEVVAFAFRNTEEKRMANDPSALMPNPVMDYVSHALPFPDRDTGELDEYGQIGQMRDPTSPVKGPLFYAPAMEGEAHKGFTKDWAEPNAPTRQVRLAAPFDKQRAHLNQAKHPSYDQIYAGPMPEIFPAKRDFRKPTRWDFKEIQNQSKYKFSNPY